MVFRDKTLTCRDCGGSFLFTEGEQGFYLEKGLLNDPQRCPGCRAARRSRRDPAAAGPRVMTPVVCGGCGAITAVPFVPRLDRPVYCGDCFESVRAATLH